MTFFLILYIDHIFCGQYVHFFFKSSFSIDDILFVSFWKLREEKKKEKSYGLEWGFYGWYLSEEKDLQLL